MFLNISFKKIMLLIPIVVISIILIIMLLLIKFNLNLYKEGDFSSKIFENYYSSYDMTVISNKNINTYNVKEWHNKDGKAKFEYLDYMKNIITIEIDKENCYIINNNNKAKVLVENLYNNKNIMSLSTFSYIYDHIARECSCCSQKIYEKNDETIVELSFGNNSNCETCNLSIELNISKLELTLKNNKPINYIVYDKNKKEYISIVYNIFENLNK